jgi:hypothetical protein
MPGKGRRGGRGNCHTIVYFIAASLSIWREDIIRRFTKQILKYSALELPICGSEGFNTTRRPSTNIPPYKATESDTEKAFQMHR